MNHYWVFWSFELQVLHFILFLRKKEKFSLFSECLLTWSLQSRPFLLCFSRWCVSVILQFDSLTLTSRGRQLLLSNQHLLQLLRVWKWIKMMQNCFGVCVMPSGRKRLKTAEQRVDSVLISLSLNQTSQCVCIKTRNALITLVFSAFTDMMHCHNHLNIYSNTTCTFNVSTNKTVTDFRLNYNFTSTEIRKKTPRRLFQESWNNYS